MNQFSFYAIFNIILIILGTSLLLKDLYTLYHHGKLIIKVKEDKGLLIFWIVGLIIFCLIFSHNLSDYFFYGKNDKIENSLFNIFWIEYSISNIIRSLMSSAIRENGVYYFGYFYTWSKIKSHSWVSPNRIEFNVNTWFTINRSFKININEEVKFKVDEVIKRNITS